MTIKHVGSLEEVKRWKRHLAKDRGQVFHTRQERLNYIMKWVHKTYPEARADQLRPSSWNGGLVDFEAEAIKEFEYCSKCRDGHRLHDCHSMGHKHIICERDGYYYVDLNPVMCNYWREEKRRADAYKQKEKQTTKGF